MKSLNLKNGNKISIIAAIIINIFCSFFLIFFSYEKYEGIEFDYNTGHLIFLSLSFICLTVIMTNRSDCLFIDDNLIRLSRIGSRRTALRIELFKIILIIFIYEVISLTSLCLFSLLLKKDIQLKQLLIMFVLGYFIKLFLMIIQFAMDRIFAHNIGFMLISFLFLLLLLSGSGIYYFCEQNQNTDLTDKLFFLNRVNLINYISMSRTRYLTDNNLLPLFAVLGLNVTSILSLFIKIKKLNLLPKE